jgi:hypothetical protein
VLLEDVQVPDATSRYGEWRLENSLKKFGGVETVQALGHRASKVRSSQVSFLRSISESRHHKFVNAAAAREVFVSNGGW